MKLLKRTVVVLLLLVIGIGVVAVANAIKAAHPVGFRVVQIPDGTGGSFPAGVWYPTTAFPRPTTLVGMLLLDVAADGPVKGSKLPLIVISHGNGGGPGSHADLAMALAGAGYVVAAPMHTGDNYLDQSALATANWLPGRTRELKSTLDYMVVAWPEHARINAEQVGAYGFSAGGFTVLTAIGAKPDLGLVAPHCAQQPEFVCELLRQAKSPLLAAAPAVRSEFRLDARIRAAVIAEPGLGFTMAGQALSQVSVPVQLWSGDGDADGRANVPYASNTGPVRAGLGVHVDFHTVAGARHMSFLVPCGLAGPPALCGEPKGFDRKAFHAAMNASVIDFFNRQLGTGAQPIALGAWFRKTPAFAILGPTA